MEPRRHFTSSSWEPKVGYCRALRQGPFVWVAGTAASAEGGGLVAPGEHYAQAVRCFEIVRQALLALDARPEHVVRTRMYVSDGARWEEYGRAHREAFGDHPPVSTLVEVKGFVDPAMTIEVEVDAYVPEKRSTPRLPPKKREPAKKTKVRARTRRG